MKVLGTANPADLKTKHLTRDKIDNAFDKMGQTMQEGRANSSLDIQDKINGVNENEDCPGVVKKSQQDLPPGVLAPRGVQRIVRCK